MSNLDGTKNGNLGQLTISIPAYLELMSSLWLCEWRDDMDEATLKRLGTATDAARKVDFFSWLSKSHPDAYQYMKGKPDRIFNGIFNNSAINKKKDIYPIGSDGDNQTAIWEGFTSNQMWWDINNNKFSDKLWDKFARCRNVDKFD